MIISTIPLPNSKLPNVAVRSPMLDDQDILTIQQKVFELKERQVENLEIIACYNYNEVKNDMKEIVSKYDGMLNTLGINKI